MIQQDFQSPRAVLQPTRVNSPTVPAGLPAAVTMLLCVASALNAQGILTVTPSAAVTTSAGTGTIGSSGDHGAATAAVLANPNACVFDVQGNLYIADAANHVIREISMSGSISAFAGTEGAQGFSGDNGPATAATLDTPTGVAIDLLGNVYIADSHNHRIREVSNGVITTIAGIGVAGFGGDNAAATNALLSLPSAVAVDASGDVFVADTNNQRIREISAGNIITIAGDGEQFFSGDGSSAISAVLDSPTGVAVDANGNVYVADRHNHRVRVIVGGTISTIAGSGAASLSGGFSGEGGAATSASLSRPASVSVDLADNVYIADTGNQRIRQLSGGILGSPTNVIATIAGSGQQGFGDDGVSSTDVNLDSPKAVALNSQGDLAIADTRNQRVRAETLPMLTYASDRVGIASSSQNVTLANTGTAAITIASVSLTGPFTVANGGSCVAPPISLAPSTSCVQAIAFLPVTAGAAIGKVIVAGTGTLSKSILLRGAGVQAGTSTSLTSNIALTLALQPVTFTALVTPAGLGDPSRSVIFYDGATAMSPAQTLIGNIASFSTSGLTSGTHNITAAYSGDANYTASNSLPLNAVVIDFSLNFQTSGSSGTTQTVAPGATATYVFALPSMAGPSPFPLRFSANGLPTGASVTFTPQSLYPGSMAQTVTMRVQTANHVGLMRSGTVLGGTAIAFGLLFLPFTRRSRGISTRCSFKLMCACILLSTGLLGSLTGCGSTNHTSDRQTSTINVFATMTGIAGATLQRSIAVTLIVE